MTKNNHQKVIETCKNGILESISRWKKINAEGGSDPFWCDGVNMNLLRNHVLYYRMQLKEACNEAACILPYEYYLPVPPVVPDNFMGNRKQKQRIKNLSHSNHAFVFRKNIYDENQLHF